MATTVIEKPGPYWSGRDAAKRLGISHQRVHDLLAKGRLPSTRFGTIHLIHDDDLEEYQQNRVERMRAELERAQGGGFGDD